MQVCFIVPELNRRRFERRTARQLKIIAKTALCLTAAATVVVGVTSTADATTSVVTWKNAATSMYLAQVAANTNGSAIGTRDISAGIPSDVYTNWSDSSNGDGTWTETNTATRQCLDSNNTPGANGTAGSVYALSCNGGNNQRWYEVHYSEGWKLTNKATGLVLDSNLNGRVYMSHDNSGSYQRWQ